MGLLELFLLAVGLSMDAFAVSICKGLSLKDISGIHMLKAGLWFGGFQALMPVIGYMAGSLFADKIQNIDHWIAFILLGIIGINMIKESLQEDEPVNASMEAKEMFILAVATSIDALAVGVSLAFMKVSIVWSVAFIGLVTFTFSALGIKVGSIFGAKYKARAEITGGIVLILIGVKILLQHLGILP